MYRSQRHHRWVVSGWNLKYSRRYESILENASRHFWNRFLFSKGIRLYGFSNELFDTLWNTGRTPFKVVEKLMRDNRIAHSETKPSEEGVHLHKIRLGKGRTYVHWTQ